MFGAFKATNVALGGLLWKFPLKLSRTRKYRQRKRLQAVDNVLSVVTEGLVKTEQIVPKKLQQLNNSEFFPKEHEMLPRDKYTVYSKKTRGYRKGIHRVPKWTKVSQRVNPKYY
ncbi:mitochondrial 54S ribosomal protein mL60 [Ascoidea rubescens DSM 1968]|uniref:Large ribosomal subunit protein mL60 n=1 Tax=Ascoidea rubescens DSM 1968 TaxID=1344418 RepID=A0A1D2VS67_9ASCO|nr:60s ribosomal protein l31 [Ascoidea rubescens DSM 1968]ODV64405.1 60s ribosomal protein l31 [Ascoidea rubescens DSM 1968]